MSDNRPGYSAVYLTTFINTTGLCIEFFYWLNYPSGYQPKISVYTMDEGLDKTEISSVHDFTQAGWNRYLAQLPGGVNRVAIEGIRAAIGQTSLALDDVIIQRCSVFGKFLLPGA